MKKNVSFSLLGLILLLCIGVAACSVYYQYTYSNLQSKYGIANETLHETMSDYQEKERILDAVLQNLTIAERREEVLGEKYVKVETEKERLQTELTLTKDELTSLWEKHDRLERNYDSLSVKYGALEMEKRILEDEVDDLKDDIKELNKRIDELEAQLAV